MGLFRRIGSAIGNFFGLGSKIGSTPVNPGNRGPSVPPPTYPKSGNNNPPPRGGRPGIPSRPGNNVPPPPPRPLTVLEKLLAGNYWVDVVSSNLSRISYVPDLNGGTLRVIFKDENEYHVWPMSKAEMTALYQAGSKGGWYWDNVRVRGTTLGHKKRYVHVKGHGEVQRKWIQTFDRAVAHLNTVDQQSQNAGYGKAGVLPESVPIEMFLTGPPEYPQKK